MAIADREFFNAWTQVLQLSNLNNGTLAALRRSVDTAQKKAESSRRF